LGGVEEAGVGGEDGDVEVDAPGATGGLAGGDGGEGLGEVVEELVGVVLLDDGLMEVAGFGEGLQVGEGVVGVGGGEVVEIDLQGAGDLDFAEADVGGVVLIEDGGLVFELDAAVADVVAEADVVLEALALGGGGVFPEVGGEEMDDFVGMLEEAAGFGFEIDVDEVAGVVAELGECVGEFLELLDGEGGVDGGVRRGGGAPAEGEGGDAAFGGGGQEIGEDVGEVEGVLETLGLGPVRGVDFEFDGGFVEVALGEAVEGEGGEGHGLELVAEVGGLVGGEDFVGDGCREPEADGHGGVGGVWVEEVADLDGVALEIGEQGGQIGGRVDAGAISQLDVREVSHAGRS
jgi:hypothetical protein